MPQEGMISVDIGMAWHSTFGSRYGLQIPEVSRDIRQQAMQKMVDHRYAGQQFILNASLFGLAGKEVLRDYQKYHVVSHLNRPISYMGIGDIIPFADGRYEPIPDNGVLVCVYGPNNRSPLAYEITHEEFDMNDYQFTPSPDHEEQVKVLHYESASVFFTSDCQVVIWMNGKKVMG